MLNQLGSRVTFSEEISRTPTTSGPFPITPTAPMTPATPSVTVRR